MHINYNTVRYVTQLVLYHAEDTAISAKCNDLSCSSFLSLHSESDSPPLFFLSFYSSGLEFYHMFLNFKIILQISTLDNY